MDVSLDESTKILTVELSDEEERKLCNMLNVTELTTSIFNSWIERCIGEYIGDNSAGTNGLAAKDTDGRGTNRS